MTIVDGLSGRERIIRSLILIRRIHAGVVPSCMGKIRVNGQRVQNDKGV